MLNIPSGASSGEKLRLKGKGIKSKTSQGDEIVTLQVVLPQVIGDDLKKFAEKMDNYAVRDF